MDDGVVDGSVEPEEAFAVLGDETRLQILRALGDAEESLAFSELFDRVDYETTANFSYHLEKLSDHFVADTDDGYELQEAGKRVVEAVLSGTVTDAPVLEPTNADRCWCPYCGAPAEISYAQERIWSFCPECPGTYSPSITPNGAAAPADYGFIGYTRLPPAGLQDRSFSDALAAASLWSFRDFLAMASGVCPRCAAVVEQSTHVCRSHDADGGRCERCNCRHAVQVATRCTNCIHETVTPLVLGRLVSATPLVAFLASRGVDPLAPDRGSRLYAVLLDYEEDVRSVDPFRGRFTFQVGEDSLTLTVDDELEVVDVERRDSSEREPPIK